MGSFMTPHFSLVISPGIMEMQTEILFHSIETNGKCKDYFCTIFIQEKDRISNKFILNHKNIKIKKYKPNHNLKYPWSSSPRYLVDPTGDVSIHIDSDMFANKNIKCLFDIFENKKSCYGVVSNRSPFKKNSLGNWKDVFRTCGMKLPEKMYVYKKNSKFYLHGKTESVCPYYLNMGLLMMPPDYNSELKKCMDWAINKLNRKYYNNFYLVQLAFSVAIQKSKLDYDFLPCKFNNLKYKTLNHFERKSKETVFYHYHIRPPIVPKLI